MDAFSRLASFFLFVFSLGLLVFALPTAPCGNNAFATLLSQDKVTVLFCLVAHPDAKFNTNTLFVDIQACTKVIVALGPVKLDAKVEPDIAAKIAAIILVIVKACVEVTVKLSLEVVLAIFAKRDLALKCLLVNIGICVEGIMIVIAKIVVSSRNDLLVKLNFKLCLVVFAAIHL
ncbi:unnamed protein product [Rhizoctonia solani]|uniref:Transmembrane protein n=1 Tax=Rhizoctonia solani TaxID=456999 RepID=A0A8H3H5C4_9AGAM|nr:unnamed protein product [Rhizoctonia solani]